MILKLFLSENTKLGGDIGTFYFETNDERFIEEVQKFVCPVRLIQFISTDEINSNKNIRELITDAEINNSSIDIFVDLTQEMNKILIGLNEILDINKYIEETNDKSDKYGNEK